MCTPSGRESGTQKHGPLGGAWRMGVTPMNTQFWAFSHRCIMCSSWVRLAATRYNRPLVCIQPERECASQKRGALGGVHALACCACAQAALCHPGGHLGGPRYVARGPGPFASHVHTRPMQKERQETSKCTGACTRVVTVEHLVGKSQKGLFCAR